jgi:hypothetical protein
VFGGVEKEKMWKMREAAGDVPRVRRGDEFDRTGGARRRRHRDRIELKERARIHEGSIVGARMTAG